MATNIRELRVAAGMVQKTLATQIGVSQAYLSDVELGKKRATPGLLSDVATVLKCNIEDIAVEVTPERAMVINRLRSLTDEQIQAVDNIILLLIRRNHV